MSGLNYYELLGLSTTATDVEIRRAYLRLSLQWHPDKRRSATDDAHHIFRSIQEAYETLSCPEKRCLYDFVGAFAALADASMSHQGPLSNPPSNARKPHFSFSTTPVWSSNSIEVQTAWDFSSSSTSRSSPCQSSGTYTFTSSSSSRTGCLPNQNTHPFSRRKNLTVTPDATHPIPLPRPTPSSGLSRPPPLTTPPAPTSPTALGPSSAPAATTVPSPSSPSASIKPSVSPGSLLGKRRAPGADPTPLPPPSSHLTPQPLLHPHPPCPLSRAASTPTPIRTPRIHTSMRPTNHPAPTGLSRSIPGGGDVHHRLILTLEELYCGCEKQLRLARRVYRHGPLAGSVAVAVPTGTAAAAVATSASGAPGALGAEAGIGTGAGAVTEAGSVSRGSGQAFGGPGKGGDVVDSVEEELFRVVVKPGWREGTKLTFPGKGDTLPCGASGDMVVVLAQAAHTTFTRRGHDLHTVLVVPLADALTGGVAALTTLDGRRLTLPLGPSCLHASSVVVVRGEGMPIPPGRVDDRRGNAAASTTAGAAAPTAADTRRARASVNPSSHSSQHQEHHQAQQHHQRLNQSSGAGGGGGGGGGGVGFSAGNSGVLQRGDLHVRFEVSFPSELTAEQKGALRGALHGTGTVEAGSSPSSSA